MLSDYRFSEAYDAVYRLVWHDFADWYIEASKTSSNNSMLAFCLETILKLAHPFAPFVTETIWQTLAWEPDSLLIKAAWPKVPKADTKKAAEFEEVKTIVSEIRDVIMALGVAHPKLYYTDAPLVADNATLIARLARLDSVSYVESGRGLHLTRTKYVCWLDVDHDSVRHYRSKLEQKLQEVELSVKRLEGRLGNESYVKNAPKAVVEQTREQLATEQELQGKIARELEVFSGATKEIKG